MVDADISGHMSEYTYSAKKIYELLVVKKYVMIWFLNMVTKTLKNFMNY